MVNAILAKRVNHIVTKGDNPAWPKGSKSRGFSNIYRSPKILNLNFLLDLKELRSIGLDGLSNVEEMPDLSNLHSLTGMSLANMKRLQSFPLYHENLKNLLLQLPFDVLDNIIPENLPNLKHISVNLGSDKKNGMVLDRFKGICEVGIW